MKKNILYFFQFLEKFRFRDNRNRSLIEMILLSNQVFNRDRPLIEMDRDKARNFLNLLIKNRLFTKKNNENGDKIHEISNKNSRIEEEKFLF